ncbi:MAG: rRNA maturation RNase YbeY [Melioribacteraceae bacterium]|nr:rRNA maturation RNase YbeY [Melioribacteraceae bacterium]
MIKDLIVSSDNKFRIDKKNIHSIVAFLKNELNFTIFALEINFISNDEILRINKEFLDHHYYTDIITFNYSGENENLEGELFISYDEALENSKKYKCSFNDEIVRLVIHGILHLLGFDDVKEEDKKNMKKQENKFLKLTLDNVNSKIVKDDK